MSTGFIKIIKKNLEVQLIDFTAPDDANVQANTEYPGNTKQRPSMGDINNCRLFMRLLEMGQQLVHYLNP
jgi:hypothetical protein